MKQILCSDWLPILLALLGVYRDGPIRNGFRFGHVINPLWTKLDRSSLLHTGLFSLCVFIC